MCTCKSDATLKELSYPSGDIFPVNVLIYWGHDMASTISGFQLDIFCNIKETLPLIQISSSDLISVRKIFHHL